MDRQEELNTSPTIPLHRGLYIAIVMARLEGSNTTLIIALHGGL
jgi:hypothetical protein